MGQSALRGSELSGFRALLGGSWDLVSTVISTLIGVIRIITIVTLFTTPVTKSHDPLSRALGLSGSRVLGF